jgi:hypothetical protein
MKEVIANIVICMAMLWVRITMRAPFLRASRNAAATQEKLLRRILHDNAQTEFGKEHGFAAISSVDLFREKVPVSDYDALSPYIKRQQEGCLALTVAPPVFYARTSGTTGRHKDIPMTKYGVGQIRHFKRQLVYSLWSKTNFFKGTVLGFFSPGIEGTLPNGIPYGSTSGATYESLSPMFAKKFGIPKEAYTLTDVEAKYETYALSVLVFGSTTGVFTVNPSSLLKVCLLIEQRAKGLLAALVKGDVSDILEDTASILPRLREQMRPAREAALTRALDAGGVIPPEILWSSLSTLVTWTGGSCGIALDKLKIYLPSRVKVVETGFACSEFSGTVNVDADRNICLPMLTDNFYEFVERDDRDSNVPKFLTLTELQPGRDYYIFATTTSGLYRYDINDVVRATEGLGNCPGLRFVRKGKGVTNITGEKLSEDQVISAVSAGLRDAGHIVDTFLVLADEHASAYRIFIEAPPGISLVALSEKIETELRQRNGEYDDKRASGRLHSVKVGRFLEGVGQAIKARLLKEGVRESQYKPPVLGYWKEWSDWIGDWVDREAS